MLLALAGFLLCIWATGCGSPRQVETITVELPPVDYSK
jgi:hypothetical protein